MAKLERRLQKKEHAVIVVAEGAGQDLLGVSGQTGASGNVRLKDVSEFLCQTFISHFESRGIEIVLRYFDPSYQIRG